MLNAGGARSCAGGGAQEDAKAFLCALKMVAAALQYISQSGPLRERNMTNAIKIDCPGILQCLCTRQSHQYETEPYIHSSASSTSVVRVYNDTAGYPGTRPLWHIQHAVLSCVAFVESCMTAPIGFSKGCYEL
jgi:hypothetical protein